jgi:hypothetical protein
MSASQPAVKFGVVAAFVAVLGALLLGAVGRVHDAADRAQ